MPDATATDEILLAAVSNEAPPRLRDVALSIGVRVGKTKLPLRTVLALRPGDLVQLEGEVGANVEIVANGDTVIARGELVEVGEEYGVRVLEFFGDPADIVSDLSNVADSPPRPESAPDADRDLESQPRPEGAGEGGEIGTGDDSDADPTPAGDPAEPDLAPGGDGTEITGDAASAGGAPTGEGEDGEESPGGADS